MPFLVPSTSPLHGRVRRRLPRIATRTRDSASAETRGNPRERRAKTACFRGKTGRVGGVAEAGLETVDLTTCDDLVLARIGLQRAAFSGAVLVEAPDRGPSDPNLQLVIEAWCSLSDDAKAGILAIVKAVTGREVSRRRDRTKKDV